MTHDGADLRKKFPCGFRNPQIEKSVFLAPGCQVVGDVHVGKDSGVWFNAVLRGDVNYIRIGERTNIQDFSMVHVAYEAFPTIIGNDVTIGHGAIIHACTIGNVSLIGMGSVILDGAQIGDNVLLGAGSLVTPGTKIPSNTKAFGRPAKVVSELSDEELQAIRVSSEHYVDLARVYFSLAAKNSS